MSGDNCLTFFGFVNSMANTGAWQMSLRRPRKRKDKKADKPLQRAWESKCKISRGYMLNKLWYMHVTEYYPAIKRMRHSDEPRKYYATWKKKKTDTEGHISYDSFYLKYSE